MPNKFMQEDVTLKYLYNLKKASRSRTQQQFLKEKLSRALGEPFYDAPTDSWHVECYRCGHTAYFYKEKNGVPIVDCRICGSRHPYRRSFKEEQIEMAEDFANYDSSITGMIKSFYGISW